MLLDERRGFPRLTVVFQRGGRDAAEIEALEKNLLGIAGPFDLDVPEAAFVGLVELHVDRAAVGEPRAQFVLAEVVVVRRIDADEADLVAGAVDDGEVAVIGGMGRQSHHGCDRGARKQFAHGMLVTFSKGLCNGWRQRAGKGRQRPQPASLLQASCAFGLAFSHCVIERVSLFDILLFMQVQYLSTTGALWPSSLLSDTHTVIHLVSSALWRWASAGAPAATAAVAMRARSRWRI